MTDSTSALDTDYENGVADVIEVILGDAATVRRNVRLVGRKSGRRRQVDALVTGPLFGGADQMMVVDCKLYSRPVDVKGVESFIGLIDDVGAETGLLVTANGVTPSGRARAENERGIRVDVVSARELGAWRPRGTVVWEYDVPADQHSDAVRIARRTGWRARTLAESSAEASNVRIEVFRYFSADAHGLESRSDTHAALLAAWSKAGITNPVHISNGVVSSGGTPLHRWLEVSVGGEPIGTRVLVSSEEDIDEQLTWFARDIARAPREVFDVVRPEVWPIPRGFPNW